jgi:hypothetical protein
MSKRYPRGEMGPIEYYSNHRAAILRDLQRAVQQIPERDRAAEAEPLQGRYERLRRSRLAGPQAIGELLLVVLER